MKIGVIADDLTGANATAVRLTQYGFKATTLVHYNQEIPTNISDVVCIDTDSRYASEKVSKNRVKTTVENLSDWKADIICKRIDSTVRGNLGLEIDTMLDEIGNNSISIVVASFPDSGRITSGGYLLVHGIPVQQTDVAKDPVHPLKESFIPSIIERQSKYEVSHIKLEKVLDGPTVIKEEIKNLADDGNRIIVIDAVTNENIENIAKAMTEVDEYQLIPTDPGPLTALYSYSYMRQHSTENKVVLTVGSVTDNTKDQMDYLLSKIDAEPIIVDAAQLVLNNQTWEAEINRVIKIGLDKIKQSEVVIFTTMSTEKDQLDLKEIAQETNLHEDFLAKKISDALGKITRIVCEKSEFSINGIFSCGGDVTASICSISEASGITLQNEIEPLIAYGYLKDGYLDGIPIITKGGMAGSKKAIFKSYEQLLMQGSYKIKN